MPNWKLKFPLLLTFPGVWGYEPVGVIPRGVRPTVVDHITWAIIILHYENFPEISIMVESDFHRCAVSLKFEV